MNRSRHPNHDGQLRTGAVLAMALVALLAVSLVMAELTRAVVMDHRQARRDEQRMQLRWYGESAMQRARHSLAAASDYPGEVWLIPEEIVGSSRPIQVSIQVVPADAPASARWLRIEVLDPESTAVRVLHRSERFIELRAPTDAPSASSIPNKNPSSGVSS
jgi:hypothetical protein